MKILIVDDDRDLLNQAKIYLETKNDDFDIHKAMMADKALEKLDEEDYDVIVSDYQMPKMDGLEFLEILREERDSDIPFIIFTGRGREKVAIEALNLGADRYIQKGGKARSQYGVLADAIRQEYEMYDKEIQLRKSEREKRNILNSTSELVAFQDKDHKIIWANKAAGESVGKSSEELEGLKCYEIWNDKDEPCENCPVEKAIKTDELERGDMRTKDGRYWSIVANPVKDKEGDVEGIVKVCLDLTKRKEAEDKMQERIKRDERLFENLGDAVFVVRVGDEDHGEILKVNSTAVEQTGWEEDELLGRDIHEAIVKDPEKLSAKNVGKKLENDESVSVTLKRERKDGSTYWAEEIIVPFNFEGNKAALVVSRDITERRETKQRLEMAIGGSELGIWDWNIKNDKIEINEKWANTMGYDIEEVGKDISFWKEHVHPDDLQNAYEKLEKHLEGETENFEAEYRIQTKEGSWRWIKDIGKVVEKDKDGEPNRIVGVQQDITESKKAEKNLRDSERKLKELHEVATKIENAEKEDEICKIAVDAAENVLDFYVCSIVFIDENGKRVIKAASKDVSSDYYRKVSPDEETLVARTFYDNTSYLVADVKKHKYAKPAKEKYRSAISVPIENKGVFQAISPGVADFDEGDLEMAELLIDHVTEALERKEMRDREEFLHSLLRHDVRNKSSLADGYLELIEENELPDEVEGYLKKARDEIGKNLDIIDKIRKLREIEEEGDISEINLQKVIDDVLSKYESQAEEKGIEIKKEECDFLVEGGSLLEELFSNLIENSIKHSSCDEIKITPKKIDGRCVVTIEDDGKGISEKEKIFEKGYKKGDNAGTGLGMYIVKEIVGNYNGSIEVEDVESGGSRFIIYLNKC